MKAIRTWITLLVAAATLALAGCGGHNATAMNSGTVSGLSGGTRVQLLNNGGDAVVVNANGSFSFPIQIQSGNGYNVTVGTQPIGETCTVTNPSGVIDSNGTAIVNITVSCSATISSNNIVFGIATGIPANTSVTLLNNGTDTVVVSANGSFAFPTALATGAAYSVTMSANTTGLNCTLLNTTGIMPSAGSINPVLLSC